jgi:hypothetical protein
VEVTRSDAAGRFSLSRVPLGGVKATIAARAGDRFGMSTGPDLSKEVRIQLAPTTRVSGRVELGGRVGAFSAIATFGSMQQIAVQMPVRSDGTFELDGIPAGDVVMSIAEIEGEQLLSSFSVQRAIRVGNKPVTDVTLELPAARPLTVVIRPTKESPQVLLFLADGRHDSGSYDDVQLGLKRATVVATHMATHVDGVLPADIAAVYRPNDLVARFRKAPVGAASACALPFSARGRTEDLRWHCQPVAPNAELVVLELPRS